MRSSWRMLAVATLIGIAALGAAGRAGAAVSLKLTTPRAAVAPGDTIVVRAEVTPADSAFNAFDLVVRFDPALVTFIPQPLASQVGPLMSGACANLFHVFSATTDSTVADLSLLCAQTFVTGPGTIYQLKFKSNGTNGLAQFSVGRGTRFIKAGVYVNPVLSQGVSVTVNNVLAVPAGATASQGFVLEAPRPNPWRRGGSAQVNFTLPSPASVDLALFDMQGRRLAGKAIGEVPAGATSVHWASERLPAGRYELQLRADGRVVARRSWVLLQ